MNESPKNLVGYCGLYCGACVIYQGKIKQAVENMRKVIYASGIDKITSELANWEPAFLHYKEFEKILDSFVKLFGNCPGCVAGGGKPGCAIRECCKQRAFSTCAECAEMDTCEKRTRNVQALKEMQKIKALGVDKWANEMQKKVDAGYCYLDDTYGGI